MIQIENKNEENCLSDHWQSCSNICVCRNVQIDVRLVIHVQSSLHFVPQFMWVMCNRVWIQYRRMCVCVSETQDELHPKNSGARETERGREVPGCCQTQCRDDEVMHCELQKQYGGRGIISGWGNKNWQIKANGEGVDKNVSNARWN